jgi:HAD superfamily hydrolase (TIGR01484 family)
MLHYSEEKVEFKPSTLETAPQPWMKALFTCNHPRLREVEQFVKSLSYEGFYFVFSGERYFEILPTNVTKGTSLKRLADFLKIKHNNTVAIGDFYNDLNLIQLAGIGAAVKEAPDDVKAVADIVVGSCEGGAVADLIEYLEDKYK